MPIWRCLQWEDVRPVASGRQLAYTLVALSLMLVSSMVPVFADSSWSGHRPSSDSSNITHFYRNDPGGGVSVSNRYSGSDASSGLAVENYEYIQNFGGTGKDEYVLRVLAGGNTRVNHQYSISSYSNQYDDCSKGFCTSSGLTNMNQGAWFSLGFTAYFWGTPYNRIFACSNGWAAFSYSGDVNNCPAFGPTLPTPDSVDSNGNIVDVPEGIIAGLWKPLDPSYTATNPTIRIDTCSGTALCWFFVVWQNVMTAGTQTACLGGPCINDFSLGLDNQGDVYIGIGFVDPREHGSPKIGVEDPSGYMAVVPSYSSAVASKGVLLQDAHYSANYDITDSKIIVDKQSTTDGATVNIRGDFVQGWNIKTSNPPPAQNNQITTTTTQIAAEALVAGLCFIVGIGTLGCLVVDVGAILVPRIPQWLWPQPNPPTYTIQSITDPTVQTGYLEAPVQSQEFPQSCGAGGCVTNNFANDEMIFDIIEWTVPHDTSIHNLSIQYGIQIKGSGTWDWTPTVNLSVDAGDLSVSPLVSPSSIAQGCSASSTITLTSVNNLASTIGLTAIVSPNVLNGPTVYFSPSSVSLAAGGSSTSTMTIQTGSSTPLYSYNVTATGTDSSGVLRHSQNVSFNVIPADYSISANPASISVTQETPGTSMITVSSCGFSGSIALSANAPSGFTATLNPSTVSLSSGGTTTSTLTVSVSGSPTAGSYNVGVTGTSGSLSHSASVQASYPGDFSISPTGSLTWAAYPQAWWWTSIPTVTAVNGFTGTVSLTSSSSAGLSTSLSPSSLTLTSTTTSATGNIGFYASSGGLYSFTITGSSGSLSHSTPTLYVSVQDFSLSTNPTSFNDYPGSPYAVVISAASVQGWSGTVQLSISLPSGWTTSSFPSSLSFSSGSSSSNTFYITPPSGAALGTYTIPITGTASLNPSYTWSHTTNLSVTVISPPSGGGGGGSVAAGTLITLADGTQAPVQNLRVGMQLRSYDMTSGQYVTTTVTRFVAVTTNNTIVVSTSSGKPLILDQNPNQELYALLPDGTLTMLPVTQLTVGDSILYPAEATWVPITSIRYETGGNHVMYDVYMTTPSNYIANGVLVPDKCPCPV